VNKRLPLYPIKETGIEKTVGYWRKLRELLPLIVGASSLPDNKKIKIKISGDGRRAGKRRKQVIITASILSAGDYVKSPTPLPYGKGTKIMNFFNFILQACSKT